MTGFRSYNSFVSFARRYKNRPLALFAGSKAHIPKNIIKTFLYPNIQTSDRLINYTIAHTIAESICYPIYTVLRRL